MWVLMALMYYASKLLMRWETSLRTTPPGSGFSIQLLQLL
jgi:hypothetical protein